VSYATARHKPPRIRMGLNIMNIIGGNARTGGQVRGLPVSSGRTPIGPTRGRKDGQTVRFCENAQGQCDVRRRTGRRGPPVQVPGRARSRPSARSLGRRPSRALNVGSEANQCRARRWRTRTRSRPARTTSGARGRGGRPVEGGSTVLLDVTAQAPVSSTWDPPPMSVAPDGGMPFGRLVSSPAFARSRLLGGGRRRTFRRGRRGNAGRPGSGERRSRGCAP
jgi:hypothetical protein